MSRQALNRLLEDGQHRPALLAELRKQLSNPLAAQRWAEEHGYQLADDEIAEIIDSERELDDDDLDQAAGGDWAPTPPAAPPTTTTTGG